MNLEWKTKKLGEVCDVIMGQSPDGSTYNVHGEGMPLINGPVEFSDDPFGFSIQSKFTTQPTKLCKKGDLLLCVRGSTTGRMNIAGFDACIGRGVAAIRAKDYQPWINHFINWKRYEIYSKGSGATFPNVSSSDISQLQIKIPPLPEQHRIVRILDEAFASLATAQANAEKNLENARGVFEGYLQEVFEKRGEGWVEHRKPLVDLCQLIVDCEHKTAPTQEYGVPSIRTPNIGFGRLLLNDVNRVSEETYKIWTRRAEPQAGDLILAREAPAGNVAVIPENTRVCLGQRTVLIRPNRDFFDPPFLAFLLLEPRTQAKLLAHSKGATVQHVNMKDIRALDVGAIPPPKVQQKIVSKLWDFDGKTQFLKHNYKQKLEKLTELKKTLLYQAFNGEL
jgi:type I restriction enzyme S subunit